MDKSATEIKKLQEENQELRDQLENLRKSAPLEESSYRIYDSSPTGIIIVGDNYKIEYVNQVLADIFNL
ncbi:MAG: hypothetical protein PF450_16225, partial [Bacteroidales bacterium]|nr:hypothetical protein [Bacteroidales bacterium]